MGNKASEHPLIEQYRQTDREAFALLLKPAIVNLLAQGRGVDLETNEEIPRLIPILCAYFSREELVQLVGEQMTVAMFAIQRTVVLQNLYLERTLDDVLRMFDDAQIPLMLFKGPALAYQFYAHPHLRTYHDIDAFIHPEDQARAHELLIQHGFVFYEEFRSNVIDITRAGYNYILKHPDSWLEMQIELHTAPHPSDIGAPFNVQDLWERAKPITLAGRPAVTMDDIDHLLYLCWHYRFHGFSRLLWLYDLVELLRGAEPGLDWSTLAQRALSLKLATTLYYCLSWCRDLFHVAIPENIFQQLRPPLLSRFIVERLCIRNAGKALVLPEWRSRRVIARRAMVDSDAELLKAALRMLFPSKATIGRRYISHTRLPLHLYFLFYFVHPIVTLIKGARFFRGDGGSRK